VLSVGIGDQLLDLGDALAQADLLVGPQDLADEVGQHQRAERLALDPPAGSAASTLSIAGRTR
jgi:hypothetical protein